MIMHEVFEWRLHKSYVKSVATSMMLWHFLHLIDELMIIPNRACPSIWYPPHLSLGINTHAFPWTPTSTQGTKYKKLSNSLIFFSFCNNMVYSQNDI